MSTQASRPTTFTPVNLNDVDPAGKAIPDGIYNFKIGKAEVKSYTPKGGEENSGEYVNTSLLVTDSPSYSGRRFYVSFFPGDNTNVQLRKLMDATAVPVPGAFQGSGDVVAWLDTIRTEGATFSAAVATKDRLDKRTGETSPRQEVQGFSFGPAQ